MTTATIGRPAHTNTTSSNHMYCLQQSLCHTPMQPPVCWCERGGSVLVRCPPPSLPTSRSPTRVRRQLPRPHFAPPSISVSRPSTTLRHSHCRPTVRRHPHMRHRVSPLPRLLKLATQPYCRRRCRPADSRSSRCSTCRAPQPTPHSTLPLTLLPVAASCPAVNTGPLPLPTRPPRSVLTYCLHRSEQRCFHLAPLLPLPYRPTVSAAAVTAASAHQPASGQGRTIRHLRRCLSM